MAGGVPGLNPSNEVTGLIAAQTKLSAPSGEVQAKGTDEGVQVFKHSNTGINDGRKEVASAGTAVTLAASTACTKVTITAEEDNTGVIVVGGSSVVAALGTRQGTPLNAGQSYTVEIDDLVKIYLDSTASGDGVTYSYMTEV